MKLLRTLFTILTCITISLASIGESSFGMSVDVEDRPLLEELPDKYNYDYKSLDYMTSVKDQGDYGICWAFSTIACCEADAIKNHGASNTLDLSERHLAYFTYAGTRDGDLSGDTISIDAGSNYLYEVGGHDSYAQLILSNHIGLRMEEDAPYNVLEANPYATLSNDIMMGGAYYLDNTYVYAYQDTENIKSAIMQYGAVSVGYYFDKSNAYLNTLNYAQYCPYDINPNHAVTIVGWDDTYSRYNFKYPSIPAKDGAWLVKNSYGESWGKQGYFWLSYEDKTATECTAYDVVPSSTYDNIYQYDGSISMTYLHNGGEVAHYANVFSADADETLEAVGVILYGETLGIPYTIKVYKNPTLTRPNSGTLLTELNGVFSSVGYTNIPISEDITLKEGDKFSVVISTSAKVGVDCTNKVGVINSTSHVNAGESFTSYSGVLWKDAYQENEPYNVRIKALTKAIIKGEAEVLTPPTVTLYYGQNLADATITGGEVVDKDTGTVLNGVWKIISNSYPTSNGTCQAVYEISDIGYLDVIVALDYTILPVTPTIDISLSESKYDAGSEVSPIVVVKNAYTHHIISDLTYTIYYRIGDGEEQVAVGGTFSIPEGVEENTYISIRVVSDGNGAYYEEATASMVIQVGVANDARPTPLDKSAKNIALAVMVLSITIATIYTVLKKS